MNTPKEITTNYVALGATKTQYTAVKMLVLGVMAGIFIGLGSVGSAIATATVANTTIASLGKLLGALVFPVGLIMILITGGELFTGNCLIIISVLEKQVRLKAMLKNWLFVYVGNFIGSILVALIVVYGGTLSMFGNEVAVTAISTAVSKVTMPFGEAMLRGVLCNFLVCVAVFASFASKDVIGKVFAAFLPIMLFVLSGYEHSIANMTCIPVALFAVRNGDYYLAYGAASNIANLASLTWGSMLLKNLLPVTIGNIVGGSGLVGFVCWFLHLSATRPELPAKKAGKKK